MPHSEPIPYAWEMRDAAVLAHRFALPAVLPAYTALTVSPGQSGLVFMGNSVYVLPDSGLHLVTASLIHTIAEGAELSLADYEGAVLPYNSQITLFDMRQKLWYADPIELRCANGENLALHLSLSYHVVDVEKLDKCGASYQGVPEGSELRQDDPQIAAAFESAVAAVTTALLRHAGKAANAAEATERVTSAAVRKEIRSIADEKLLPLGLQALAPHLGPARAACPYCQKPLSLTEIKRRFCSAVDDDGKPQKGCNRRLHTCPYCQTIVGPERSTCPNAACGKELLFCNAPSCNTYRRVERGRFCPVCRGACYPLPDREFLTLM